MCTRRWYCTLMVLAIFLLSINCKPKKERTVRTHQDLGKDLQAPLEKGFSMVFGEDETIQGLLESGSIYGQGCTLALTEWQGRSALAISTDKEFSDAFIPLEKMLGHPFDITAARFFTITMSVPDKSYISALKLNFKDAEDNFGGIGEVVNNFYGNYKRWMTVTIDLGNLLPDFQNWHGTGNPLGQTTHLSLNPYNGHQAAPSTIYVHSLALSDTDPRVADTKALADVVYPEDNIPFVIDFDDPSVLHQQMAYRSFESSFQALGKNIGGNPSMAIRLKGNDANKYIAFLPKLHQITGNPVDFTKYVPSFFLLPSSRERCLPIGQSLFGLQGLERYIV